MENNMCIKCFCHSAYQNYYICEFVNGLEYNKTIKPKTLSQLCILLSHISLDLTLFFMKENNGISFLGICMGNVERNEHFDTLKP